MPVTRDKTERPVSYTHLAGINDGALGGEQGKEGAAKEEQASAQDQAHTKGCLLYTSRCV